MFGEIENIIDNAINLDDKVAWFEVIDREIQFKIVRLNTIDQLKGEGLLSDGTYLPDYSEMSVQIYGKEEGHIQLKDTGQFYRSFVVKVDSRGFNIVADTKKGTSVKDDLAARYGINILGLTIENQNLISDALIEKYKNYIYNEIFK